MARQKSSAPSGKVFDTAMRGSAFFQTKANADIVCEAKDNGLVYDPACGSGASLPASRLCGVRFAEKDRAIAQGVMQSEKFVESHGGVAKCEVRSASVEVKILRPFVNRNSSFDISRADTGKEHADTFRHVQHPDLRADWQIANAEVRLWN